MIAKAKMEERAKLGMQLRQLVEETEKSKGTEGGGWTAERRQKFDAMSTQVDALQVEIDDLLRVERSRVLDDDLKEHRERSDREGERRGEPSYEDQVQAFAGWALGDDLATQRQKEAAKRCGFEIHSKKLDLPSFAEAARSRRSQGRSIEQRATGAQTITTTKGGYTIQTDLLTTVESAMKEYGGMREASQVIQTDGGNPLNIPTDDDAASSGAILAINAAISGADITFGQLSLNAFKYTSGLVLVPIELLQDTAIDLVSFIGQKLGMRVARVLNNHFTVGIATNTQPRGAITEASVGVEKTTGTVLTYTRLNSLIHSVDPAYRRSPGARVMFHDNILRDIKALVDGQSRPLWWPGLNSGMTERDPDTLMGYKYSVNQDMVSSTTPTNTTNRVVAFGNFKKYLIRDAMGIELYRLNERYADKGQVAFFTFSRHDGRTLIATTVTARQPIRVLRAKST